MGGEIKKTTTYFSFLSGEIGVSGLVLNPYMKTAEGLRAGRAPPGGGRAGEGAVFAMGLT